MFVEGLQEELTGEAAHEVDDDLSGLGFTFEQGESVVEEGEEGA